MTRWIHFFFEGAGDAVSFDSGDLAEAGDCLVEEGEELFVVLVFGGFLEKLEDVLAVYLY